MRTLEKREPRRRALPPEVDSSVAFSVPRLFGRSSRKMRGDAFSPLDLCNVGLGNRVRRVRKRVEGADGVSDRNRPRVAVVDSGGDVDWQGDFSRRAKQRKWCSAEVFIGTLNRSSAADCLKHRRIAVAAHKTFTMPPRNVRNGTP